MASRAGEICQAIAAYLNAVPDLPPFRAAYVNYQFVKRETDQKGIPTCYVQPQLLTPAVQGRRHMDYRYGITIGVYKHLKTESLTEVDDVIDLAERIPRLLYNEPMAGAHQPYEIEEEVATFNDETYREASIFFAQLTFQYMDVVPWQPTA